MIWIVYDCTSVLWGYLSQIANARWNDHISPCHLHLISNVLFVCSHLSRLLPTSCKRNSTPVQLCLRATSGWPGYSSNEEYQWWITMRKCSIVLRRTRKLWHLWFDLPLGEGVRTAARRHPRCRRRYWRTRPCRRSTSSSRGPSSSSAPSKTASTMTLCVRYAACKVANQFIQSCLERPLKLRTYLLICPFF